MPVYSQELNKALEGFRTSARYDENVGGWIQDSAMWVKNAAGIYVPVSDTNPMPSKLTGSIMPLVDSIIGAFAVSTSAVPKSIANKNCTVHVLAGNCWINPLATAVADNTAIKLLPGMTLDLRAASSLSLISDSTGATVQVIVWAS